ncbi:MAG TPA: formimidoylglutamase [Gemmataceae bacterium]|jgi:formiminoglutamase|nr:formimidoylglutamase [Gemmataceae bacterium]
MAAPAGLPGRPDDPRLGECVELWSGGAADLRPGRPVLIGFPEDEGVRRNGGRPGAAEAPRAIRHWLYRLTPFDASTGADLARLRLLDLGDVRTDGGLEASQEALGEVVAAALTAGALPVVLGGGHETAYGHYLGYARAGWVVGVINLDAHLDVRPYAPGQGHSGSPFRQALEHPSHPLPGDLYCCLGAQPFSVSREHADYVRQRGGTIRWRSEVAGRLEEELGRQCKRVTGNGCPVYLTVDADVVRAADVPGVSAPNPLGLDGAAVAACCRAAGETPGVTSFDLVEINPQLDRDGLSARWAALSVWHFLAGLARRPTF